NQYEFLYRALVSSLSDISRPIRGTHFRKYINQMGKEGFNRQFQGITVELQQTLPKQNVGLYFPAVDHFETGHISSQVYQTRNPRLLHKKTPNDQTQ
ncbi:hypothetical protein MAR_031707, partial [Mya arenaria]